MRGNGEITLVLGGARSGKSELAEALARRAAQRRVAGRQAPEPVRPVHDPPAVTYLATGPNTGDRGWLDRLAAHRARRPADWRTVEVGPGGSLGTALADAGPVALVDSLGTWVAGFEDFGADDDAPADGLLAALAARRDAGVPTVVVSEEVGLGVHPSTALGGAFRDALGTLNRRVADAAGTVLLVVAGRVVPLAERIEDFTDTGTATGTATGRSGGGAR